MQREPSQFVSQVRNQIYPIIERLNDEKQQSISGTSVRVKRKINKAVSYFENGIDLLEKAFSKEGSKKRKQQLSNGSRSQFDEGSSSQRKSYRRQPEEQTS